MRIINEVAIARIRDADLSFWGGRRRPEAIALLLGYVAFLSALALT